MKKMRICFLLTVITLACCKKEITPDVFSGSWTIYQIDSCIRDLDKSPMEGRTIRLLNDKGFITFNLDSTGMVQVANPSISCDAKDLHWYLNGDNIIMIDCINTTMYPHPDLMWYEIINTSEIILYWDAVCPFDPVIGVKSYYKFYMSKNQ